MIRLLIADDEPIEREAMRLLVSNHFPGINIVAEAENGFQALQQFHEQKPDLVMMDINMPGMDGMDTIRQMLLSGIRSRYIIVTSYNQFEYARRAIQLGVEDYIIKPAGLNEIRQMLERLEASIKNERENLVDKETMNKRLKAIHPVLKSDIIRMLSENAAKQDFDELFTLLSIKPGKLGVFIIQAKELSLGNTERLAHSIERLGFKVLHENRQRSQFIFVIIRESAEMEMDVKQIADFIKHWLIKEENIEAEVFPGMAVQGTEDLTRSWAYAMDSYIHSRGPSDTPTALFMDAIVTEILNKNRDRIHSEVNAFILEQHKKFNTDKNTLSDWFSRIMPLIKEKVAARSPFYVNHYEEFHEIETMIQDDQPYRLCKIIEQELYDIIQEIELGEETKENPLYLRLNAYMKSNFNQGITLDDLAQHLNVSPSYASRLVKHCMGTGFSECITRFRLEESKRLLLEGKLSIKEIAFNAGFASQHYFSRVFKKHTGYAPTDYLWSSSALK
ncbi:MAG: response regulator [Spirochaetia bacterium]|jgi:two-component system response regulator YesN|nr:response regulator [Spirochaetia bacterium]